MNLPQIAERYWFSIEKEERRQYSLVFVIALLYLIHYLVFCILQPFYIEDAGISFAFARNFADGDIVTRWIGETAAVGSSKANKWVGKRSKSWKKDYCFTQGTGKKHLVFAPACDEKKDIYGDALFFCAHLINHSDDPNCQVDKRTMEVRALYPIAKREELTIKYNR